MTMLSIRILPSTCISKLSKPTILDTLTCVSRWVPQYLRSYRRSPLSNKNVVASTRCRLRPGLCCSSVCPCRLCPRPIVTNIHIWPLSKGSSGGYNGHNEVRGLASATALLDEAGVSCGGDGGVRGCASTCCIGIRSDLCAAGGDGGGAGDGRAS